MPSISQSNKRIAKNTFYMYVRFFVTVLVGLYTSRVVLQVLGVSDYGLYNVVGGILALFSFLSSSLGGATARFLNYEMGKVDGDVNKAFNINLALHIAMAIVIFVFAEIGGLFYIHNYLVVEEGKLDDAIFVYQISILVSCLGIINTPYSSLFSAKEKFKFLAVVDIANILIRLGLIISLLYYKGNVLRIYAVIMAFTTLSNFVIYHVVAKSKWPEIISFKFVRGWNHYKEVLVFSWWNLLSTIAVMVRSSGSDMLINSFFGTAVNGAYAISRNVTNYVLSFTSYFEGASAPQITQSFSAGDQSRCSYLVNKLGRINLLLFLIILFPLYIELDFVLHIWLGEVPDGVLLLCKLNLALAFVSLTSSGIVTLINAYGDIKWFKIAFSSFFVLCVPVCYVLYKLGLPYYVILVLFIIADLSHRIVQFILVRKLIKYDIKSYLKESYTRPAIILLIMAALFLMYSRLLTVVNPFLKAGVIFLASIIACALVYSIGLTKTEKNKLVNLIKSRVGK